MHPFLSVEISCIFFAERRFYDLNHENETGFSFTLESITGIAQYHTETGFCFVIANQ